MNPPGLPPIIASRPLQMVLYRRELLPAVMDAITEGWALGRRAKPLRSVHWEEYWARPLAELRQEYNLVQSAPAGPLATE